MNRLVLVEKPDEVSGALLTVTESGHAVAAVISLSVRSGAEIVSESPDVFRAIAAHATEVADRLESRHAPTYAAATS